jgi:tetratricopeptide (TPR) repeat protein
LKEISNPVFLIEAESALENQNYTRAIELCERGIEYFPDYYLGYVLLIEAYEGIRNFEEADKIFHLATNKFANNILFRQIPRRREKFGSLLIRKNEEKSNNLEFPRFEFLADIKLEDLSADDPNLIPGLYSPPFKIKKHSNPIKDLQIFYDFIAETIPNAQIYTDEPVEQIQNNTNISNSNEQSIDDNTQDAEQPKIIPTETLAEIYIRQQKIREAIAIYQQLIQKYPEKAHYYNNRIDSLKVES